MLQQNLYNENNRYLRWTLHNLKEVFRLDFLGVVVAILGICHIIPSGWFNHIVLILLTCFYLISAIFHWLEQSSMEIKKPLVVTARIKRLISTCILLWIIVIFSFYFLEEKYIPVLILTLLTSFNFYFVFLAMLINYPMERGIYHYYEKKAKNKLKQMNHLKIIGITGSYGKTSSKNILNDILAVKYNTCPTPKNLNTYYGLMITINNHLDKFDEIFIAEMGAYVKGEIHGLCQLVKPKYGILTTIGTAHLETFGSRENIQKGKFELIESLPEDGIGVLNKDDPYQVDYKLKNKCKIIWIGIEDTTADLVAKNIKCSSQGTTFDLVIKGKNEGEFTTKLLGKHNVYNILASLALGIEFNIPTIDLIRAVKMVQPDEHRLELKKLGNFYQIDDAYNSNPVGAKSALEVLANFTDGLKIVVTPGMIELGDKEKEYNFEFGRQIASVADTAILIGKKRTIPILEGLKQAGFPKENIIVYDDILEAFPYLQSLGKEKKVYALFENDLPDMYNE